MATNEVVQSRLRQIIESVAKEDSERGGERQVGAMFLSSGDEPSGR